MLGTVIGDFIGSYYELNATKDKNFPLLSDVSTITDDTVLSTAVAETLLSKGVKASHDDFAYFIRLWGLRYPNAGYGGNFRKWLSAPDAPAYNSWGNGSAMRVSPIGWFADTRETTLKLAEESARCTHNHPEGIKGACASAMAVFLSRKGSSKVEIRNQISKMFNYDLGRSIEEIRQTYQFEISCQKSVPEAITAFLDSEDFEDALRNAVSLGGDADTMAAISCSIAEAYYGEIPEKFTAMVLPRLPEDILMLLYKFAKQYLPETAVTALKSEI